MNTWLTVITILAPVVSAVLVAVLNNWEKINPNKKYIREVKDTTDGIKNDVETIKAEYSIMQKQLRQLSSAQKTSLQTRILEKCHKIQESIDAGSVDYHEDLKQLIILYREYYLCGFNHQGKIYFNETIEKATEDNSIQVHELMNEYFSEYSET